MTADKFERQWSVEGVRGAIAGAIVGAIISAIPWGMGSLLAECGAFQAVVVGAIIGAIGGAVCSGIGAMGDVYWLWGVVIGGLYGIVIVSIVVDCTMFMGDFELVVVVCGIIGAILGGITGLSGDGIGKTREEGWKREHQKQQQQREQEREQQKQRERNPILFDTAKSQSTQAKTLFEQKKYREALKTYSDALDNFTEASEGTKSVGDTDLANVISKNIATTQKNIATCNNSIGAEITIEAKSRFEKGDFDGAIQSYREALKYLKDPKLTARANNNLKICHREIDVRKVEELSNHAISLLNEATHSTKPFEATNLLEQADGAISKAAAIAAKHNLTEARQQLSAITQSIQAERSAIKNRITDEGVVVSGDYEIETIGTKTTGPSIQVSDADLQSSTRTYTNVFDAAKKLSTNANTLFKRKKYRDALQTYNDALGNFTEASEMITDDADLADAISRNIATIRKNITTCRNSIGTEITIEAKSKFEKRDFDGAIRSYRESIGYLEDSELSARANDNIETCYREIDVKKVEELSNRAVSLLKETTPLDEPLKSRDMLKQADDTIAEAVTLAIKRNFTEALQQLNAVSRDIRTKRDAVDRQIAGEDEVVSEGYGIDPIGTGTGPGIPHVTTLRTVWDPLKKDFLWNAGKPEEFGELPSVKRWIKNKNQNIYWFLLKIVNRTDHAITGWNVTLSTEQSLTITEAHIEEKPVRIVKSDFDRKSGKNVFTASVPPELGVSIPERGGTRRMYFKMDIRCEEALKMEFGVSGSVRLVKPLQAEVPIREKRFVYACKFGEFERLWDESIEELVSLVRKSLQNSYNQQVLTAITNSIRLLRDFEQYCNERYAKSEILIEKLDLAYHALAAAEPITKDVILPLVTENLNAMRRLGDVEAQKERGKRMCGHLVELLHTATIGRG